MEQFYEYSIYLSMRHTFLPKIDQDWSFCRTDPVFYTTDPDPFFYITYPDSLFDGSIVSEDGKDPFLLRTDTEQLLHRMYPDPILYRTDPDPLLRGRIWILSFSGLIQIHCSTDQLFQRTERILSFLGLIQNHCFIERIRILSFTGWMHCFIGRVRILSFTGWIWIYFSSGRIKLYLILSTVFTF